MHVIFNEETDERGVCCVAFTRKIDANETFFGLKKMCSFIFVSKIHTGHNFAAAAAGAFV